MMKKYLICCCILLLFNNLPMHGCSCFSFGNAESAIRNTEAIFSGKVIAIDSVVTDILVYPDEAGIPIYDTSWMMVYYFSVQTVFKAKNKYLKAMEIYTGKGNGDCGFAFQQGFSYVVYAEYKDQYFRNAPKVEKYLYTDICTRTVLYNEEEVALISDIYKPLRYIKGKWK